MNDMILIPPSKRPPDPEVRPPEDIRLPPPSKSGEGDAQGRAAGRPSPRRPARSLLFSDSAGPRPASRAAPTMWSPRPLKNVQSQRQDIADLRSHVDALNGKLEAQAQKAHSSDASIAALQKNLSEQKAEAAATTSQLQAKLEKLQSLAATRSAENRPTDRTPVASIPAPVAQANSLPGALGKPLPKPVAALPPNTVYRAYVLRDIADGRAVVEGDARTGRGRPRRRAARRRAGAADRKARPGLGGFDRSRRHQP